MKYADDENEDDENEINVIFKNMSKNISKKIESVKKEISQNMIEKQIFLKKLNTIRETPNIRIRLNSQLDTNYIINPILFCLANLEIFNEFILSEKKQEVLSKFQGQICFTVNFFHLLEEMRNKNTLEPNYNFIHEYLRQRLEHYLIQEPAEIISSIFTLMDEEMKLANINKENRFSNLIPDNFSLTLKTIQKCNVCLHKEIISEEKKYIVDLFLTNPVAPNIIEPLLTIRIKAIENLNKYLIINLNREKDPNNSMQLIYSETLNLIEEKEDGTNKLYQYKLISALSDINSNIKNLPMAQGLNIIESNRTTFKIFYKNFINDKWYMILDVEPPKLFENIQEGISSTKANILIYKRTL